MSEAQTNGGAGKHRYWGEVLKEDILEELKPIRERVEGLSVALTEHRAKDHRTRWELIVGVVLGLGGFAGWVLYETHSASADVKAVYTFLLTNQPQPRLESRATAAESAP